MTRWMYRILVGLCVILTGGCGQPSDASQSDVDSVAPPSPDTAPASCTEPPGTDVGEPIQGQITGDAQDVVQQLLRKVWLELPPDVNGGARFDGYDRITVYVTDVDEWNRVVEPYEDQIENEMLLEVETVQHTLAELQQAGCELRADLRGANIMPIAILFDIGHNGLEVLLQESESDLGSAEKEILGLYSAFISRVRYDQTPPIEFVAIDTSAP